MSESIFKRPALIAYLVKSISGRYTSKQIGKTVIQKMIYILSRKGLLEANYSMYHYGPYSQEIAGELNFAESSGLIEIKWIDDKGYFITSVPNKLEQFEPLLREGEKLEIDRAVEKFGGFNANELSIIATAIYLKDKFKVDDSKLIEAVHEIKDQYMISHISSILKKSEVIH